MTLRTVLPSYQAPPGLKFISKRNTVGSATTADSKAKAGTFGAGAAGDDDKNGNQEAPDNSPFGFLRRYWYIIVPMMLMNIMGGAPEEEQKDGQQQGQGQEGGQQ